MKNMAVAEGLYEEEKSDDPNSFTVYNQNLQSTDTNIKLDGSMVARKTAYAANQHSVSIVGSDIGKRHLPNNFGPSAGNSS